MFRTHTPARIRHTAHGTLQSRRGTQHTAHGHTAHSTLQSRHGPRREGALTIHAARGGATAGIYPENVFFQGVACQLIEQELEGYAASNPRARVSAT